MYIYIYVCFVLFFCLIAKKPTLNSIWIDILELAQNLAVAEWKEEKLSLEENSWFQISAPSY